MQKTENYPDGNCLVNSLDITSLAGDGDPRILSVPKESSDMEDLKAHVNSVSSDSNDVRQWYVLRVTYGRGLMVRDALTELNVETFLPMVQKVIVRGERRFKQMVPAIPNIIFVKATTAWMKEFKAMTRLPIRYFMDSVTGKPLIVPEKQMKSFISVASLSEQAEVLYLDPTLITLAKGAPVRVKGGIFDGAEGRFVRIRGDRRVVVTIPGVAAVATTFVHPSLVEPI